MARCTGRAGLHRLEVCKRLGWQEIPARVLPLGGLMAELAENPIRNELTTLERGEHLKRRKEIYETLYPEARHVNKRGGGPGRGHKTTAESATVSFVADTAAKTGRSRSAIAGGSGDRAMTATLRDASPTGPILCAAVAPCGRVG